MRTAPRYTKDRNTSTCVEKTDDSNQVIAKGEKHLHVRGEDSSATQ